MFPSPLRVMPVCLRQARRRSFAGVGPTFGVRGGLFVGGLFGEAQGPEACDTLSFFLSRLLLFLEGLFVLFLGSGEQFFRPRFRQFPHFLVPFLKWRHLGRVESPLAISGCATGSWVCGTVTVRRCVVRLARLNRVEVNRRNGSPNSVVHPQDGRHEGRPGRSPRA